MSQHSNPEDQKTLIPENTLDNLISKLGSAIGVLSAATLALSVFYDYSYLAALGLEFSEIQTSLGDHIRSAVVWIPTVVIFVGFLVLIERALRTLSGPNWASPVKVYPEDIEATKKALLWHDQATAVLLGFILISYLFMETGSAYYLIFMTAWAFISMRLAIRIPYKKYIANKLNVAFALVPIAIALVGCLGSFDPEEAIKSQTPSWRVTITDGATGTSEQFDVKLLRRFASTAVLLTMQNSIRLIPDVNIKNAEKLSKIETRSIASSIRKTLSRVAAIFSRNEVSRGGPPASKE